MALWGSGVRISSAPPFPVRRCGFRPFVNFTDRPPGDPSPLFELYRANYASELLVASATHFDLFVRVETGMPTPDELRNALGLDSRAGAVLITALRALDLLTLNPAGRLMLSAMARDYLLPDGAF